MHEPKNQTEPLPDSLKLIDPDTLECLMVELIACISRQITIVGEISRLGQEHESYPRLKQEAEDNSIRAHKLIEPYSLEQRKDLAILCLNYSSRAK